MPQRALVLLAHKFEEIEATCPIDLLRRAEVDVVTVSCENTLEVTGRSTITLLADQLLGNINAADFDLLVLPGGPSVFDLRENSEVLSLIKNFHHLGKPIGAICAAPLLLLDAGLIDRKTYTAHGSVGDELPDMVNDQAVVSDDNLITSRGAGTAVEFGLALIARLKGEIIAEEIRQSIHA